MATHSSILAWRIPWMEELGGLQSMSRKESDTTEGLYFHFSLSCTGEGNGEGNGSLLQCSCLENPRDGGAWWAAVYGVTQSDTTEATEHNAYTHNIYYNICIITFLKVKVKVKSLSRVRLCDPWTIAHQAPPSMGFSRQEYWSGLPFPSPGDLPDPRIKPNLPHCRHTL